MYFVGVLLGASGVSWCVFWVSWCILLVYVGRLSWCILVCVFGFLVYVVGVCWGFLGVILLESLAFLVYFLVAWRAFLVYFSAPRWRNSVYVFWVFWCAFSAMRFRVFWGLPRCPFQWASKSKADHDGHVFFFRLVHVELQTFPDSSFTPSFGPFLCMPPFHVSFIYGARNMNSTQFMALTVGSQSSNNI